MIEKAVRESIKNDHGNSYTGDIYLNDLNKVNSLSVNIATINTLEDLKYMPNLQYLSFFDVHVNDLSALVSLSSLKELNLDEVYVNDALLSNLDFLTSLSNLNGLSIQNCDINSLESLRNLNKLTYLQLYNDNLSDVSPLKNLSNLKILSLKCNKINDISPIASLDKLEELYLEGNNISNYSSITNVYANLIHKDFDVATESTNKILFRKKEFTMIAGQELALFDITNILKDEFDVNHDYTYSFADNSIASLEATDLYY